MLDLKLTTDDEERLKTNILPGETGALEEYVRKKSYRHKRNVYNIYGKASARNYASTTTIFLREKQALF